MVVALNVKPAHQRLYGGDHGPGWFGKSRSPLTLPQMMEILFLFFAPEKKI